MVAPRPETALIGRDIHVGKPPKPALSGVEGAVQSSAARQLRPSWDGRPGQCPYSCILTTVNLPAIPTLIHGRPNISQSDPPRDRRSHPPPHTASTQTTRRRFAGRTLCGKKRRSLRWRHRRSHPLVAAHHFASHGDPYQSRTGRGRKTRPVALVSPQRKSSPPIGEEPARTTVMKFRSCLTLLNCHPERSESLPGAKSKGTLVLPAVH